MSPRAILLLDLTLLAVGWACIIGAVLLLKDAFGG